MTLLSWLLAVLLVLICGSADRVIGWGEWGRTKPVIATVLALAGDAWGAHLPWPTLVTLPLAFLAWRTPPWGWLGGSINPAPTKAAGTFFRHLLALAFLVPAYFAHASLPISAAVIVVFALVATALAVFNYYNKSHANQTIEFSRGVALGVALVVIFFVLPK